MGWKITGLPLFASEFSLHHSSEECDVDPLCLGVVRLFTHISVCSRENIGVGIFILREGRREKTKTGFWC